MQKSPKMVPTWPHHGTQILSKSMPKASPGRDFLGDTPWECLPGSDSLGEPPWESLPGRDSLGETPWKDSFRAGPPRYPKFLEVPRMTFYRLLFRLAFRSALERHFFGLGTEKLPKMEPKPSQNPVENVSKVDFMMRRLKSESEQTLPHFCSFLLLQVARKSSQNRLRNSLPLRCSKK